jgi:hypothetical protein
MMGNMVVTYKGRVVVMAGTPSSPTQSSRGVETYVAFYSLKY